MGLYLCVFDGDDELDGVEVGRYSDFGDFRDAVLNVVEHGKCGAVCPILMLHSDCDGEWAPAEAAALIVELDLIARKFAVSPAQPLPEGWKSDVAKQLGVRPSNLAECFFDVDGEPLLERLSGLAKLSVVRQLPIKFQ